MKKSYSQDTGAYMLASEIPHNVSAFYSVNKVSSFSFDRPFHRGGPVDPSNDAKTRGIERTTLTTSSNFPGILKWFEVTSTTVSLLSPVVFACETVRQKNSDLSRFLQDFSLDSSKDLRPFTMILLGTIDAAVNGGINKYREAFFCPDWEPTDSVDSAAVDCLAGLIGELARLLEDALDLHADLAPEDVKPLHLNLVKRFNEMKGGMGREALVASSPRTRLARIVNTPLPPVPKLERKDSGLSVNSRLSHQDGIDDLVPHCRSAEDGFGVEVYHDIDYKYTSGIALLDQSSCHINLPPPRSSSGPPLPPRSSSCSSSPGPGPPLLPRRPSKKSPRHSMQAAGSDTGSSGGGRSRPASPHSPPPTLTRRSTGGVTRLPPPLPPR